MQPTPSHAIRPGDTIPASRIGLPEQQVISNEVDHTTMTRTIVTSQGSWTCGISDLISWPRRDERGTTIHWPTAETIPTAQELCVGDLLAPAEAEPDVTGLDPALTHVMREAWKASSQVVTSVARDFGHPDLLLVRTKEIGNGQVRAWLFAPNEPVTFPRPPRATKKLTPEQRRMRVMEKRGPYERTDGQLFFFLIHPSRRGRWPVTAPEFDRDAPRSDAPIVCRPPDSLRDWAFFTYLGEYDGIHPKDPHTPR